MPEFGLVANLFTRDLSRALRVSEALETGMIGLNQGLVSNAGAPFGGVKQSGLGRELGPTGLAEYREIKHTWHNIDPAPQHWFASSASATPSSPPDRSL